MPTKRVPIYEPQIGMYVAKLDLSWFRSPFLRHPFLIGQDSQIEKVGPRGSQHGRERSRPRVAAQPAEESTALTSKVAGIYPVHSYVRLDTKELAVVTGLSPTRLRQPVVTITHEPEGAGYPAPFIVDLAGQEDRPRSEL